MLNNVFIEGNLAADVNVKVISDSMKVGQFTLGVTDKVAQGKDKTTSWVECVCWNKTCEILASTFVKGDRVSIAGKLKQEQFTAKDGTKVNKTKVIVDQIINLPARAPAPKKVEAVAQGAGVDSDGSFSFD